MASYCTLVTFVQVMMRHLLLKAMLARTE